MRPTGDFSCSSVLINQLHHNILWSMKGNFLDVPTDCPQRDERMGWTGDAQIFCATATKLMDVYTFYRKWLADVRADQTAEGGVPHVVPDIITPHAATLTDWLLRQGTHSAARMGGRHHPLPLEALSCLWRRTDPPRKLRRNAGLDCVYARPCHKQHLELPPPIWRLGCP